MRKRGKSLLAAFMTVCMLLSLMPATAMAADAVVKRTAMLDLTKPVTYAKRGGGNATVDPAAGDIMDSAEGWSWDSGNKILTLSGADIRVATAGSDTITSGIDLPSGASLVLTEGTESIVQAADHQGAGQESYGIFGGRNLKITGKGTLRAYGGAADKRSCGIYTSYSDLTISDQAVVLAQGGAAAEDSYGIYAYDLSSSGAQDRVTYLSGDAKVTAAGGNGKQSYGIYAYNGLTISGNADVTATAGAAPDGSYGIYGKQKHDIVLSGNSKIRAASGTADENSTAIHADSGLSVLISGNADVTAIGGDVTATDPSHSSLLGSYGIYAGLNVDISGGKLNAQAGKAVGTPGNNQGRSRGVYVFLGGVTIKDSAEVRVAGGQAGYESIGIDGGKRLTISGKETAVTAASGQSERGSYGIFADLVAIEDAKVQATSGTADGTNGHSEGIRVQDGQLQISGVAHVTAQGGSAVVKSAGIESFTKGAEISGAAYIAAQGGAAENSYGILIGANSSQNNLQISGTAQVIADGGQATKDSIGIALNNSMNAADNVTLTATGGKAGQNSYGIHGMKSGVSITVSGSITANGGQAPSGKSYGIYANSVDIIGGIAAANGETAQSAGGYGIYTSAIPGQITISNALAEIQGKTDAVNKPPVVTNAALLGRKTQDGDLEPVTGSITGYRYLEARPAVRSVAVSPSSASVSQGTSKQFTATVTFMNNSSRDDNNLVNWGITGANDQQTSIHSSGLLTVAANESATNLTVTAQYKGDIAVTASAIVSVSPAGRPSSSSSGGKAYHTVSVQTGKNGSVSPDGSVQVGQNDDQTFIITPDEGYEIYDVLVDGTSVGAVEKYTLKEVSAKHTIQAEFVASFTDVSSSEWYHEAVRYVIWNKLFSGTGDGQFSPDESMSRAMLAAVLYRAAGEPGSTGKEAAVSFADVDADSWYGSAVYWAQSQGIIYGVGEGVFLPDAPITREQFAVMLYRYAGSPAVQGDLSGLSDAAQVSPWAADALSWALNKGIITGKDNHVFDPQGRTTRAEVASMLMRYRNEQL